MAPIPDSPISPILEQLTGKDLLIKKHVKAALQAILVDFPEMAVFNQLYVASEAIKKIAGIEIGLRNQKDLTAIQTILSDIDVEYPDFPTPAGDCPKEIIEALPQLREPAQRERLDKWKVQLRALLIAAPALFPPQILTLAGGSYGQIMQGLPAITWSDEAPALQISRIYNLVK